MYIKTYVVEDWRYIPVVKYLKFHYVNENETDKEMFFKEDWAHLHTNLFWLKNKAAFHFQQSGPPLQQDPCNRVNLRKSINDINKRIKKVPLLLHFTLCSPHQLKLNVFWAHPRSQNRVVQFQIALSLALPVSGRLLTQRLNVIWFSFSFEIISFPSPKNILRQDF